MFSITSSFYYFNNSFFAGYSIVVIILMISTFVLKGHYRNECFNWIYVLNTLVAYIYVVSLLIYASELFMAWYGQNPYEWYAFSNTKGYYTWTYFMWGTIINFLLGLLFLSRKLRINRLYIVLFLILVNFELFLRFVTSFYTDYLPSSWATNYNETILEKGIKKMTCLLIIAGTYWVANKRKKLPHPSVFLK
jgi:hypothetical protein